ncbi:hypothetical protein AABB24_029843 [Solanum stoloniferum]|uniref:Uncharacterized protein n=1 Tax=Solanum stoloniferum TaxID=62892 RepID=A0ABD2S1X2_9SOLN
MEGKHHVFSVDLLERYATKGRGAITCMATGNDVIVLGTNKDWVIRHDFGVGDSYVLKHFSQTNFEEVFNSSFMRQMIVTELDVGRGDGRCLLMVFIMNYNLT